MERGNGEREPLLFSKREIFLLQEPQFTAFAANAEKTFALRGNQITDLKLGWEKAPKVVLPCIAFIRSRRSGERKVI